MKKLILTACVLGLGATPFARTLSVGSIDKVQLPDGLTVNMPAISPDGSFIVISDAADAALRRVDLTTGQVSILTPSGNINGLAISQDGSQVVFRRTTTDASNLRYNSLVNVDIATGTETTLVEPTRHLNTGIAMAGNSVTAVASGRTMVKGLAGSPATQAPVASISYGHLQVTTNGQTSTIDPQGNGSYLWPSVSPDGTKVLYYLVGRGCFVCNLDGSQPRPITDLRAPRWLDNEMIVGMDDLDDGYNYVKSAIVASDLDGKTQTLTDHSVIAMYPTATATADRIAFATPAGDLYIITLK